LEIKTGPHTGQELLVTGVVLADVVYKILWPGGQENVIVLFELQSERTPNQVHTGRLPAVLTKLQGEHGTHILQLFARYHELFIFLFKEEKGGQLYVMSD